MKLGIIEVNGDRYLSLEELIQAIAYIRECSRTRREALNNIVDQIQKCRTIELDQEIFLD
jgi:hypothetical protein